MAERLNIGDAVSALGGLLGEAFGDAISLEIKASTVCDAFRELDYDQMVVLGEAHPRLVEGLLSLEHHFDRRDSR